MARKTNPREFKFLLDNNGELFKRLRSDRRGMPCCECITEVSEGRRIRIQKAIAEIKAVNKGPNTGIHWDPICMTHMRDAEKKHRLRFAIARLVKEYEELTQEEKLRFNTDPELQKRVCAPVIKKWRMSPARVAKVLEYFRKEHLKPPRRIK